MFRNQIHATGPVKFRPVLHQFSVTRSPRTGLGGRIPDAVRGLIELNGQEGRRAVIVHQVVTFTLLKINGEGVVEIT